MEGRSNVKSSVAYGLAAACFIGAVAARDPLDDNQIAIDKIGPDVKSYGKTSSKYMPHQGKQEIARRLRQEAGNG